jgi:ribosomal protein S18 acetylase RimI-like enzyme
LPVKTDESLKMKMSIIENVSRLAWPALEEKHLSFGVLRYAGGVSRRSNSMNIHPWADYQHGEVLRSTESFFEQRGLPAIVRILGDKRGERMDVRSLDNYLDGKGYGLEAPTKVLFCNLRKFENKACSSMESVTLQDWLKTWQKLAGHSDKQVSVHKKTLKKIKEKHCFLVLKTELDATVSCGMAVIIADVLGIYGVATSATHRSLGYATRLLQQLMYWGSSNGAGFSYLQVESSNLPALSVYEKLGFTELYNYWYRVKNERQGGSYEHNRR